MRIAKKKQEKDKRVQDESGSVKTLQEQALENLSKLNLIKGKTVKLKKTDKEGNPYKVPTWVYEKL